MRAHHEKHWADHPGVPTGDQLSFGDRAADWILSGMGTWTFVLTTLSAMVGWILTYGFGIDNPQLTILNLILSCMAAMQGSLILIAQKRQAAVAASLAKHDREKIQELQAINEKQSKVLDQQNKVLDQQTQLLEALHEHLGIAQKEGTPSEEAAR